MAETKRTLIEDGTELKGTLTSTCPIVVMGRVDGEMTGPSVEVTESGTLCGKAKVTERTRTVSRATRSPKTPKPNCRRARAAAALFKGRDQKIEHLRSL
jgi:hypothetical protein